MMRPQGSLSRDLAACVAALAVLVAADARWAHAATCPAPVARPLAAVADCTPDEACCSTTPTDGDCFRDKACDCCSHPDPSHRDETDSRPVVPPIGAKFKPKVPPAILFAHDLPRTAAAFAPVREDRPALSIPQLLLSNHLRF